MITSCLGAIMTSQLIIGSVLIVYTAKRGGDQFATKRCPDSHLQYSSPTGHTDPTPGLHDMCGHGL